MSVDPPITDLAKFKRRRQYDALVQLGLATPTQLDELLAAEDAIAGDDESVRGMLDVWGYIIGRLVARKVPLAAFQRLLAATTGLLEHVPSP